jgi:hypothetical protein
MSFILPKDWPKDPAATGYGKYLYAFFTGALDEKPKKFDLIGAPIIDISANKCAISPVAKPIIMEHQMVFNMSFQGILKNDIAQRGMLAYYGTGSGKTCVAASVIDAAWDTDRNIVFVTSVDVLASNPPSRYFECAENLFPRFNGKNIAEITKMFMARKVAFLSFAQLAHYLLIAHPLKMKNEKERLEHLNFLKNSVLIIDEIHGIFKPLPNQKIEHDALLNFISNMNEPRTSNMKIAVLTATPGDTPEDCIKLLNLLRSPNKPPITVPDIRMESSISEFKKSILGLVSYLDMSNDTSRFPRLIEKNPYRLPMSMHQYIRYLDAYSENSAKIQDYGELSKNNKYYSKTRKYSNMLYNFEDATEEVDFSSKLPKLKENIEQYPLQKHFVYSSFYERRGSSQGILAIAKYLENKMGYEKLSIKQAAETLSLGKQGWEELKMKKRYILVISHELSPSGAETKSSKENLKRLLTFFNSPENRDGKFAHILLASQNFNQAMDLASVRHIHIFEPFLVYTADLQAIGRGQRHCSHKQLFFPKEWTVTIHRYISDMPIEMQMTTPEKLKMQYDNTLNEIKETKQQLEKLNQEKTRYRTVKQTQTNSTSIKIEINSNEVERVKTKLYNLEIRADDLYWKEQARKLKMIDDIIIEETEKRSRELLIIYQAMMEAAFDCPLYSSMHGIRCFQE